MFKTEQSPLDQNVLTYIMLMLYKANLKGDKYEQPFPS